MYKLIVLLMVGSVHAATIFTLNDKRTIETHLSNRDFNRIAIEKDRKANIFYDRDAFSVVHDKANRQIFVKPNDETSKYPLGFTITTEKNKSQDWLFSFRNVKARTLILQDVERDVVKAPSCEEEAVKLLNQLI
ncbi:MAG: type-F conjugative transfer system secretin TraK, partial [Legionellales bacterium]|nr:type-F conjugative transfer system secretin TraK [Legionellales bacterium]